MSRKTRQITVGCVPLGGGAPVAVQSMTKTKTEDVKATVQQIKNLEGTGCEIIRVAIPHRRALRVLPEIVEKISIPLIADIHFSKDFAIGALEQGADCVRINPGNLGSAEDFQDVARMAAKLGKAVRVGVNAGSLDVQIAEMNHLNDSEKLAESALRWCELTDACGLRDVKVSLKSYDVPTTIDAYRLFASKSDLPLHVGITEAGDDFSGAIRSAVGLGILLNESLGDTLRVSLTAPPEREVEAAWEILRCLNLRRRGIQIVSCPTCGRCEADVSGIVKEIKEKTKNITAPLFVAVMGCEVNGPGEASAADVGVAMNRKGGGVLFEKEKETKKVSPENASEELLSAIFRIVEDGGPRES